MIFWLIKNYRNGVLSFINDESKTIGIILLCAGSASLSANVNNKKNDKYYIEQAYNGIYRISPDEYNSIEKYIRNSKYN